MKYFLVLLFLGNLAIARDVPDKYFASDSTQMSSQTSQKDTVEVSFVEYIVKGFFILNLLVILILILFQIDFPRKSKTGHIDLLKSKRFN